MKHLIAVDLGASSGRVTLGRFDQGMLSLTEYHRFSNGVVCDADNQLCWDLETLLTEIKVGIAKVQNEGITVDCMGIDTWGVDFALLDKHGNTLGKTVSYRDSRTNETFDDVVTRIGKDTIYQTTGIQFLPFNTIYQLAAVVKSQPEWLSDVSRLLLIPDYLGFKLTGVPHCEYTNASTTQLLNCQTYDWDSELLSQIGVPEKWFLKPSLPNQIIGRYYPDINEPIPLASIASHDTASAILALPQGGEEFAYISSGTWSLMGIESDEAITHELAQRFNITNEGGAEHQFRVLKNIMGLWLIQNVQKELGEFSFAQLVELAQASQPFRSLINPDDICFLSPTSMTEAIQNYCAASEQPVPQSAGELARCVFESLAFQYKKVWIELNELRQVRLQKIQIIGGGSQNEFLNQLCADACECEVSAGPVEASALGNLCGQLIALNEIHNVKQARQIVRDSFPMKKYMPVASNSASFGEHWSRFMSLTTRKSVN